MKVICVVNKIDRFVFLAGSVQKSLELLPKYTKFLQWSLPVCSTDHFNSEIHKSTTVLNFFPISNPGQVPISLA